MTQSRQEKNTFLFTFIVDFFFFFLLDSSLRGVKMTFLLQAYHLFFERIRLILIFDFYILHQYVISVHLRVRIILDYILFIFFFNSILFICTNFFPSSFKYRYTVL